MPERKVGQRGDIWFVIAVVFIFFKEGEPMKINGHVYPFAFVIFPKDIIEFFFDVAIILIIFFKKRQRIIDFDDAFTHYDVVCLDIVYSSIWFFWRG